MRPPSYSWNRCLPHASVASSTAPSTSKASAKRPWGDVTASRRYWTEDVIDSEVEVTRQGTIRVPDGPGIGYVPRLDRIEKITARKEILT